VTVKLLSDLPVLISIHKPFIVFFFSLSPAEDREW